MNRFLASSFLSILGCFLVLCAFNSCDTEDKPTNPETPSDDVTPTEQFKIKPVDIGLSVKWANANLGAKSEFDPGDYYAWGETVANKKNYTLETYKFYNSATKMYTKYVHYEPGPITIGGIPDGKVILDPEDDAAHVLLGSQWRMPTKKEGEELVATKNNPDYLWKNGYENGVRGTRITYKKTQASIFLVDGGWMKPYENNTCYESGDSSIWTSTYDNSKKWICDDSYRISGGYLVSSVTRWYGRNIRPVYPK
jgi:hypothetical protein